MELMTPTIFTQKAGEDLEIWASAVEGMGFGNLQYVRKLELYGGPSVPYADAKTTSGFENVYPLPEDDLIQSNIDPDYLQPAIY